MTYSLSYRRILTRMGYYNYQNGLVYRFLIDIVHPPDVIKQVEGYNNVELIEQDITGGLIEEIWNKTGEYGFFNRNFLLKHRSVLISDYAEVITSRTGSVKTITTLLTDLPPFPFREEWNWNFDHKGADLYNSRSQFKVVGLIN